MVVVGGWVGGGGGRCDTAVRGILVCYCILTFSAQDIGWPFNACATCYKTSDTFVTAVKQLYVFCLIYCTILLVLFRGCRRFTKQ